MSKTSWFSFGHNHVHEIDGQLFDHDTIVRISAPDPRAVMVAMFGQKWAFEYDHPPDHFLMRDLPIIDLSDKAESCEDEEEVISLHDGIPAVWVCELCGQPIGKGSRCNSAIHVGPQDGNAFNGHAIATTDLAAEHVDALATIARYDAALLRCVELSGALVEEEVPIERWAVECVEVMRQEHDDLLAKIEADRQAMSKRLKSVRMDQAE